MGNRAASQKVEGVLACENRLTNALVVGGHTQHSPHRVLDTGRSLGHLPSLQLFRTVFYLNACALHPILQYDMHSSSIIRGRLRARLRPQPAQSQINGNKFHQAGQSADYSILNFQGWDAESIRQSLSDLLLEVQSAVLGSSLQIAEDSSILGHYLNQAAI